MKKGRKLLWILAAFVLLYAVIAVWPKPQNYRQENPMRKTGELPILIAHGGGNGEFPDNTLEAFYNAYSVDPNMMLETDVSITADGVILLSHDTTLDRKTNVTGNICDWNYSDLMARKVDFGYSNPTENGCLSGERQRYTDGSGQEKTPLDVDYPEGVSPRDDTVFFATTLEDLLIAFPENRINVEIKQSGELGIRALHAVLALLETYDAFDRVVLASFHEELYDEFQRLQKAGEVPKNFLCSPSYDASTAFFVMQLLKADVFFFDRLAVFQFPTEEMGFDLATKAFVNAAHRHNLAIHYWTINEPADMRLLIDIGADGIMTDYPHLLQQVYEEYR